MMSDHAAATSVKLDTDLDLNFDFDLTARWRSMLMGNWTHGMSTDIMVDKMS